MLQDFELEIPKSLNEALEALADRSSDGADGGTMPLAGGTNLLVDIRARNRLPRCLVALGNIPELRRIDRANGRVTIGSATTLSDVLGDAAMAQAAPSLVAAARLFAGQMVRNVATVAGNVACGSPAADTVPPLLSLDAEIAVAARSGARSIPLDKFFTGYQETALRPGELITAISWPSPPPGSANLFYKLGLRQGDAISVVCLAVTLTAEAGTCSRARIAIGAVAPTVIRAKKAEAMLAGEKPTPALIEAAATKAADECNPIDDLRASAEYRRHVVRLLTRRLLMQAWEQVS